MWMLHEVWGINSGRDGAMKMFMWMLLSTWILLNKQLKSLNNGNVYVNVTWSLGDK
jgi:hypothetical protein